MGFVYRSSYFQISEKSSDEKKTDPSASADKRSSRRRLLIFLVSVILRVISVTALLNFLPTIFVRFFGFSQDHASYASALFFAGGLSGSLIAGKLSEKINSFLIILVGTVIIGVTLLIMSGDLPAWLYLIFVVFFRCFRLRMYHQPDLLLTRLSGALGKGEAFGILMGTMTVTSALSPGLFGMVLDFLGYKTALYIFTSPLIASILLLVYLLKSDTWEPEPAEVSSL